MKSFEKNNTELMYIMNFDEKNETFWKKKQKTPD